jgi:hypothetical protein
VETIGSADWVVTSQKIQGHQVGIFTESSNMLEALNLPQINGLSPPWRDASPFAVASTMLSLVDHDNTERVAEKYQIN